MDPSKLGARKNKQTTNNNDKARMLLNVGAEMARTLHYLAPIPFRGLCNLGY